MSDIDYSSHDTLCMRSEIVDHDKTVEWTIAGVSRFKLLSPYNITSKEFKLSPDCKFRWELGIGIYIESIVIKINRTDEIKTLAFISRSISFRNSAGVTYDPVMPDRHVEIDGTGTSKQLLYCKLTEDSFPLKLPNDELTVKVYLKQPRCCLVTKDKDPEKKTKTASGKNGQPRDLLHGLQYLDLQPTDVTLEVGDILLPCHKFILSIRSTFFKKMLEDKKLEKNNVVKFEDMDLEVCQGFMTYIYTNEISGVTPDAVLELYNVAVKYEIDGLQDKCSLILAESLDEKNACKALKLAELHNDLNLKKASLAFVAEHFNPLKDSP